jgi:tetratricopeptide (TPR) repeat protein
MADAAQALQAAHEAGVLHRDMKPSNLLLTAEGRVRVADFGLARIRGEGALSQQGAAVGTLCYMSPEQVHGKNDDLDPRTDVFGLGATLYELLTLERAFPGDSVHTIAQRILNVDPPDAHDRRPGVPRDLARLAAKALEKRPADRIPDMRFFGEELRSFLEHRPMRTGRAGWDSGLLRARKWVRRHPTASVATAVALVAALGLLWLLRANRLDRARADRETLLAQAQWAIEVDDMDRARTLVERADALVPDHPEGHLILAAGYARYWRTPEMNAELDRARAAGFSEDPTAIHSALEHGAHGLYLQSKRDPALYAQAEQEIETALSLDPSLYAFEFTLYQMRSARGDIAGALEALDSYRAHLPVGSPFTRIVEALQQERSDDLEGALATLDGVRTLPGMTPEELAKLRWHRALGRVCFRLGDLGRAEEFLRQAIADVPDDCGSWEMLARLYLKRVHEGYTGTETVRAARDCAQRAQECGPAQLEPARIRLSLALELLKGQELGPDPTQSPAWREALLALDSLRALVGKDAPELRTHESYLAVLEAQHDYAHGSYPAAAKRYEAALDLDPANLPAAMYLGQCRWWMGQYKEGLELLENALRQWDDPSWNEDRNPVYLGALLAWSIGCASSIPDPAALARAVQRLTKELAQGTVFNKEELLSAAEFLATAPEEVRDCALALTLVESHGLQTAFERSANSGAARAILDKIARACP